MTEKSLNLSILVGNMNRRTCTPPVSPRPILIRNNSKKSRIPLASSQNLTGVKRILNNLLQFRNTSRKKARFDAGALFINKYITTLPCIINRGVTTFRQWADPPPPPIRSRTVERKTIPTSSKKKRPGSADPRFRRSLNTSKNVASAQNDLLKQSSSFCELLTALNIPDCNDQPRDQSPLEKKVQQNKIEITNQETKSGDVETEIKQNIGKSGECSPQKIPLRCFQYEVNNNNKNSLNIEDILALPSKTNDLEVKEIFNEKFETQSESKYSQTDVDVCTDITEIMDQGDKIGRDSEIIQFIAQNYDKSSRFLDGMVLNRTRSISTVYELEPVNKVKHLKKKHGNISRILLKQNYWTYIEIWAAISFLAAILMFGWFYLIPYLCGLMYPRPTVTTSAFLRRSFSDIFGSTSDVFYNLLTTRRRLY